jgi:4,5-DOPA dioxygenase extradiol
VAFRKSYTGFFILLRAIPSWRGGFRSCSRLFRLFWMIPGVSITAPGRSLRHVYPNADVPIVQLSIDETQSASVHFEIGRKLAPLRSEGVLIVGSGNLVHNLHTYAWGRHTVDPYGRAVRFETMAREMMSAGEYKPLIDYETLGREANLSIPTPDHYLPLLYVLATRQNSELITYPVEGVDGGSISMLTAQIG